MRANAFWSNVEKTDACWLWTGRTTRKGGRFGQGGYAQYGNRVAHRIAYEITVGLIPAGMQLDHLCGVTRCVNPSHLEPVWRRDRARGLLLRRRMLRATNVPRRSPVTRRNRARVR